ncbi:PARP10_14_15 [Mytilus edulis]|uniref:PARP10_14_15 n=1 Tax=Mytilus edulis TaxID=6550 RepID=A0A8S3TSD1_MYTED|nr:PARP10_14_15 [Mytilus edulis]
MLSKTKVTEALETKSKDCEICLTKYGGQFFCRDCDQYFCSNCKTSHLRANVSKNHTFTDSSELKKTHTQRSGRPFVKSWKKKTNVNETNKYNKRNEQDDEQTYKPPPVNWEDQGTIDKKIFSLRPSSTEYTIVEQKFLQSLFSGRQEWLAMFNKRAFSVTKIERVQNFYLYQSYAAKKAQIDKQNPPGTNNEKELWYDTPNASVVDSINFYGFNRSYCKDNSSVSCQGIRGMRDLPVRQDGTMLKYDSATNTNYNPTEEYVIFNDSQAYPQYCITFKY